MSKPWLAVALGLLFGCTSSPSPTHQTPGGGAAAGGALSSGGSAPGGAASSSAGATASGGTRPSGGATADGGSAPAAGGASNTGGDANVPATDGGATDGGASADTYWKPNAGLTWQWQLSESVGSPLDVDVYDIDWEADQATVDKLHAAGIKVICYVSVGSWEDFRPDADDFPAAVIGNDYEGWPGEKHVDIRSEALRAIMSARFDSCRSKGFDAIEPDNMDVFELGEDSGFPLTEKDGVAYAQWLAAAAHSRGMGIGQKNAASITSDIASVYDWALTESCYSDGNWCGDVKPYANANKPVFMCEYEAASFSAACSAWKPKLYSPILKALDLDAPVTFCP